MTAALGLPPEIARALDAEHQNIVARREATVREVAELSAATHLKDNPWFKLLTELRQLPVFGNQDPVPVLQGFVPLLQLGMLLSPDLFETVKAFAREGNVLERARQFLLQDRPQFMEAATDTDPQEDDSARESPEARRLKLPAKPREWLPEHWQAIMAHFPSKAAAARELTIDVKTISAHLQRLAIEERWGGR